MWRANRRGRRAAVFPSGFGGLLRSRGSALPLFPPPASSAGAGRDRLRGLPGADGIGRGGPLGAGVDWCDPQVPGGAGVGYSQRGQGSGKRKLRVNKEPGFLIFPPEDPRGGGVPKERAVGCRRTQIITLLWRKVSVIPVVRLLPVAGVLFSNSAGITAPGCPCPFWHLFSSAVLRRLFMLFLTKWRQAWDRLYLWETLYNKVTLIGITSCSC